MKKLIKAMIPIASALGLLAAGASSASADYSGYVGPYDAFVIQGTGSNTGNLESGTSCSADIYRDTNDPNYAYGYFHNNDSGFTCLYWLEYSYSSSGPWYGVGSYANDPYILGPGYHQTGSYLYPDGQYKVRVCFKMTDGSWTGALHCTPSI